MVQAFRETNLLSRSNYLLVLSLCMSVPVKTVLCPSLGTGVKSSLGIRWGTQKFVPAICKVVPLFHSRPVKVHLDWATSVATWCFETIFHCLSCAGDMWKQNLANLHPNTFTDIHTALNNVRCLNWFTDLSWRSSSAVRSILLPVSSGEVRETAGFGTIVQHGAASHIHLRVGSFYEVVPTWKPVGWIGEWQIGRDL